MFLCKEVPVLVQWALFEGEPKYPRFNNSSITFNFKAVLFRLYLYRVKRVADEDCTNTTETARKKIFDWTDFICFTHF